MQDEKKDKAKMGETAGPHQGGIQQREGEATKGSDIDHQVLSDKKGNRK